MWVRGKIEPVWDSSYKNFNYIKRPLNLEGIDDNLGGMLYDMSNPMPLWVHLVAVDFNFVGYSFYRMKKGDEVPLHVDHFSKYCQIYNQKREDVRRFIVFLEDYVPGHIFEIDGTLIKDYKAGEYVQWTCDVPHLARNESDIDRYTLQVTGV